MDEERQKALRAARQARIDEHRKELHDLLIQRDLIKKEALQSLDEEKITQLKSQLAA